MKRLAIFASGSGSNAENIANYFKDHDSIEVAVILTNNSKAGVLERAQRLQIDSVVFDKKEFSQTDKILKWLIKEKIDFVILAGFLLLVPHSFVKQFPNRIINIHPALLPSYGGKGMYGSRVHEAVKSSGDNKTGITIHYVNECYDEGQIIHQASCEVISEDTPDTIAQKVHKLEYEYYPRVIEEVVNV